MDRLELYRTFLDVAEAGSFTAAADRTRQSAPSVTRAIQRLEQRLGVRLFNRNTRTVRLSEAGQSFVADARRLLAEVDEVEAAVGGRHTAPSGALTVTAPAMFGRLHVAPLVAAFVGKHPQITARTLFVDRVVNLIDEGVDVAVRIARLGDSALRATELGRVRRCLCASRALLQRLGPPTTPEDLQRFGGVELSTVTARQQWSFDVDGRTRMVRPPVRMSVNTVEAAVAGVRAGVGVARLLSYQVADELKRGELRVVLAALEPPPLSVSLVTLDGTRSSARVRAFIDFAGPQLRALAVLRGG